MAATVKADDGTVKTYILAPGFISHPRAAHAKGVVLWANGREMQDSYVSADSLIVLLNTFGIPERIKDELQPGQSWSWARATYELINDLAATRERSKVPAITETDDELEFLEDDKPKFLEDVYAVVEKRRRDALEAKGNPDL